MKVHLLCATLLMTGTLTGTTMATAQADGDMANSLTFPPKSDCDFFAGAAKQRCLDRRAGKPTPMIPPSDENFGSAANVPSLTVPSSGGTFTPLQSGGAVSGLGESHTLSDDAYAPNLDRPLPAPGAVGNPWAGTPYDQGTGMPPR